MKSVMLSIQPKWCELIASGKKTIEVRKTRPQIETPFKCYIYCTASDVHSCLVVGGGSAELFHCCNYKTAFVGGGVVGNGKVIGEFVCDRIEVIACHKYHNGVGYDYIYYTESKDTLTNETQLTDYDMQQYFGCAEDGESVGYAWHISDLKIYDKPKELGEFSIRKKCTSCKRSGYESTACMYDEDCIVPVPLTRPPQSWRYIEEITDDE